jgi:hypothetical protein
MSTSKTLADAVREALTKKQETAKPKAKKNKSKNKQSYGVPMITGTPVRKASGRGG